MPTQEIVHITSPKMTTPKTPAQKRFNSLIKKINTHKKKLIDWQTSIDNYKKGIATQLRPLEKNLNEHEINMVRLLDKLHDKYKFTQLEREKIGYIITKLCSELIEIWRHEELKPLINKYNTFDFDAQRKVMENMGNTFLTFMLNQSGIDINEDEIDITNPEATAQKLREKLDQIEKEEQAREQIAQKKYKGKKTPRQLALEAKKREEAMQISKSIQSVYRQLVASLHPDREQDPTERQRKTELMQKVTVAYSNKDLLQLLELQLLVEQIDQDNINNIADNKLKYYNKILQRQLHELQDEITIVEHQAYFTIKPPASFSLTPKNIPKILQDKIFEKQQAITNTQQNLAFITGAKKLKLWLRDYEMPEPEYVDEDEGDDRFFRIFAETIRNPSF